MSVADLKGNIKKLLWFNVAFSLMFFAPIFILFLEEKFGLSQAIILQTIFTIVVATFEVPAGVFADRFGKKNSLIVGIVLDIIGLSIYLSVDSFCLFIVGEAILGIAYSFLSGTSSAILYETLIELKEVDEYKKIEGKITQYTLISIAVGSILGGFLAKISYETTFIATIFSSTIALFILLSIKEPKVQHKKEKKSIIKEAAIELILKNRELRFMLILSVFIYALNQMLFNTYQPYFKLSGVDITYFGVLFASFQIVAGFGARYAHNFENIFGLTKGLWVLFVMVIVSIFLLGNIVGLFSFIFIFLQQIVRGVRPILMNDYINKNVNSSYRTTALSLHNMAQRVVIIPLMLLLSYLTGSYELLKAINIVGVVATLLFIVALFGRFISNKRRKNVQTKN